MQQTTGREPSLPGDTQHTGREPSFSRDFEIKAKLDAQAQQSQVGMSNIEWGYLDQQVLGGQFETDGNLRLALATGDETLIPPELVEMMYHMAMISSRSFEDISRALYQMSGMLWSN